VSLLGVDIGTTMCKSAAFSVDGRCMGTSSREYRTLNLGPGRAELDSRDVWQKVCQTIREVAVLSAHDPITAMCVSSVGEAVVPVSRGREILGNSILCSDTRGVEYAESLRNEIGQEAFYRINPNLIGPQYSLPKLLWLRDHQKDLFDRADLFLLWGDLVGFLLGCEAVTNNSLANRTLLLDLDRNDWSDSLLNWSGLPREKLGRVVPGGTVVGAISDSAAELLGLPRGVRVVAGGHDQCCNSLGCGCIEPGKAVCGMGTYECITPAFARVADPLAMLKENLNIEHHVLGDLYVAFLFNQAGALVKWFRDTFAAADASDAEGIYAKLNAEMPAGPTGLLVLPHFEAPLWPRYMPDTSGVIVGLHTSTQRGEILKAIMECETFYFVESIEALRRMGIDLKGFVAAGGGAKSDRWLQIKADIFGIPFVRLRNSEGGLAGAAMLAGIATGLYKSPADAVTAFVHQDRTFEPDGRTHELYRAKYDLYRELYPATSSLLSRLKSPSL
jgi:xylulokinase